MPMVTTMRKRPTIIMEKGRIGTGPMRSGSSFGCYGAFKQRTPAGVLVKVIASGADPDDVYSDGWEHVSVSHWNNKRTPSWETMQWVKDQFWYKDEVVFQLHPADEQYVNLHPGCLHLWRNKNKPCPLPPIKLVGPVTGRRTR